MSYYALDSYQILTITALLVPSLAAIWVVFLQRDLNEKTIIFKKDLKEYRRKKSLDLFNKIRDVCASHENEGDEQSLEIIMTFMDDWQQENEAISDLLGNEDSIYKNGKYVLLLLIALFFSGLYSSMHPDKIIIVDISRIELTQVVFVIESVLIFKWFWDIYSFGIILNKVQSREMEDLEELIEKTITEMENED
jgi:hypothetical protein